MPVCPRCDRPVTPRALNCPHCNLTLKAHGHPGMPLYRAAGDTPLCATCIYDADDSCNFPKRPTAMTCTLYQDTSVTPEPGRPTVYRIPWWRQHRAWIALAVLIAVSLLTVIL
ncbi:MAG: zinc ribbon domain-containing protein [Phormidesmis sp.]